MASAVRLLNAADLGGTPHVDVKGLTLEGVQVPPRLVQFRDTKFWGVKGVSRIYGEYGARPIQVPVIIFDQETPETFDTAAKLHTFLDAVLNMSKLGLNGTLEITSEAGHPLRKDTTFEGFQVIEGPKHDEAGTLGGGFFAIGLLFFTQLSAGE